MGRNNQYQIENKLDGLYKWLKFDTTERWTGEFLNDGKPIYKRVYYSATNWIDKEVIDNISDVDKCITLKIITPSSSTTADTYQNMFDGQNMNQLFFQYTNSALVRYAKQSFNNKNTWALAIFEYTKTTDSAGDIPPFNN